MISGSGRSTGEGKSYPLQYSGLENPMDYAIQSMGSQSDMTEQLTFKLHKKYIIQSNSAVYTQKNKSN